MSNPGFKLNYSWEDLRPVRPLFVTVIVFQTAGSVISLLMQGFGNWFDTAWFGGAFATFPGFLVGLLVQAYVRPGSLVLHRSAVIFLGAIALMLFIAALTFPRGAG